MRPALLVGLLAGAIAAAEVDLRACGATGDGAVHTVQEAWIAGGRYVIWRR